MGGSLRAARCLRRAAGLLRNKGPELGAAGAAASCRGQARRAALLAALFARPLLPLLVIAIVVDFAVRHLWVGVPQVVAGPAAAAAACRQGASGWGGVSW